MAGVSRGGAAAAGVSVGGGTGAGVSAGGVTATGVATGGRVAAGVSAGGGLLMGAGVSGGGVATGGAGVDVSGAGVAEVSAVGSGTVCRAVLLGNCTFPINRPYTPRRSCLTPCCPTAHLANLYTTLLAHDSVNTQACPWLPIKALLCLHGNL